MSDDRGLAALTEALRQSGLHDIEQGYEDAAAEVIGAHGVFLPDGITDDRAGLVANMNRLAEANAAYGAEIDRLSKALEEAERAAQIERDNAVNLWESNSRPEGRGRSAAADRGGGAVLPRWRAACRRRPADSDCRE